MPLIARAGPAGDSENERGGPFAKTLLLNVYALELPENRGPASPYPLCQPSGPADGPDVAEEGGENEVIESKPTTPPGTCTPSAPAAAFRSANTTATSKGSSSTTCAYSS